MLFDIGRSRGIARHRTIGEKAESTVLAVVGHLHR